MIALTLSPYRHILFRDSFELDKLAHGSNLHSFDHFHAARESGLIVVFGLPAGVIPDLAIGTLTIPTKIPVRNCVQREKLKTA